MCQIYPGHVRFYSTSYVPDLLKQLVTAIGQQTLPLLDRLGLVDDVFAFVQAGHASTVEVLELLEAFANELQYSVLNRVCSALGKSQLPDHTDHQNQLKGLYNLHN